MSKRDCEYDVAIYLRGDGLDPDVVSSELGTVPSRSQRKGGPKSGNPEFVAKVGLWVLEAKASSGNLAVVIETLLSRVNAKGISLRAIPGVDEVFLDVFASVFTDQDGGASLEFELLHSVMQTLAEKGMSARFDISVVKE